MRTCALCGIETRNPKYCSRRCAITVNNRGVRRHGEAPGACLSCGAPLSESARSYCSSECFHQVRSERRVRRWLATGQPGAQTLHNKAIREFILMSQNGVCAICGHEPCWNGATLVFVLDHIDGDGGNHDRSNVRLICPNCDSQLPTFKARNRGRGRHFRRERYRAGLSY